MPKRGEREVASCACTVALARASATGKHDDVALLRAAFAKAPMAQRRALGASLTPAECAQEKEEEGKYDLIVRGRFGAGRAHPGRGENRVAAFRRWEAARDPAELRALIRAARATARGDPNPILTFARALHLATRTLPFCSNYTGYVHMHMCRLFWFGTEGGQSIKS